MSTTPVRILIADDHVLLADSVAERLSKETDFEVLARVYNTADAINAASELKPDTILMDIDLPGESSFEAVSEIKAHQPSTQVIYLSAFSKDHYIQSALKSGCSGYLTKDEPIDNVIDAIRSVANHGSYYSPAVRERLIVDPEKGLVLDPTTETKLESLTDREIEVLRYLAMGKSKKDIAEIMHRSVKTVDSHVHNLMGKLGIHDRVALSRYAIREGIIEP